MTVKHSNYKKKLNIIHEISNNITKIKSTVLTIIPITSPFLGLYFSTKNKHTIPRKKLFKQSTIL